VCYKRCCSWKTDEVTIAAVLLAAGTGSRYHGPTHKLLAPFKNSTVGQWSVEIARLADLDETVVVFGAVTFAVPDTVTALHNPLFSHGQATSLQVAVNHARAMGHDAIVVGLADQPLVTTQAWRSVAHADDTALAVATYDGKRRNPVRLAQSVWHLLPTSGDEGARRLLQLHPTLVSEVPCNGNPADIDTVEDLRRWNS
jgi:molybdenum cofactor cytidylyltransferase